MIKKIISSADAFVVEQICEDGRMEDAWLLVLLSTVKYDAGKKSLRLISLKEMWQYGLCVKRYLEYPAEHISENFHVFEEISTYLRRRDYVVHFIREDLDSGEINVISDVLTDERKVVFLTWHSSGIMRKMSLTYEDYFSQYISCESEVKVVRFDIYQPIARTVDKDVFRQVLLERVGMGKLTGLQRRHCLAGGEYTEISCVVLQEWFSIFECLANWLCDIKKRQTDILYTEDEKLLFQVEVGSVVRLPQMMKVYNQLIKRLNQYILRCEQ